MHHMENALSELGLTLAESKTYLACVKLGASPISRIIRSLGTNRTHLYDVIKSLKEKGLLSSFEKEGKQYFVPASPEKLMNIVRDKERKIAGILPELRSLHNTTREKSKVKLYEGIDGLKTMLDEIIAVKKEILVYGSVVKLSRLLRSAFQNYRNIRIAEGIRTKILTEKTPEGEERHKYDWEELREHRFTSVEFPVVTFIYGTSVAIFSASDIGGITIENEHMANAQRLIFEILWSAAAK